MPENQCDGCRRGLNLKGDIHFDEEGYPVMGCTKDNYTPQEFLQDMGEVHMDEQARLF